MRRVLIPRDPGVGSAIGFLAAPVSFEIVRSLRVVDDAVATDDDLRRWVDVGVAYVSALPPKG